MLPTFMTANFVAREAGWRIDDWSEGDRSTQAAFRDPATFEARFGDLLDEAVELPSFRHPQNAAYVFGPERSSLSPEMVARCDHVVKIPTRFCINLAVAGAIVMYDRMLCHGRFAPRPVRSGGPTEPLRPHVHGKVITRRRREVPP